MVQLFKTAGPKQSVAATGAVNPFLPPASAPEVEEVMETDPIMGDEISMTGLQDPAALLIPAGAEPQPVAPVVAVTTRTTWLVGASGGVGVSTLASLANEHVVDAAALEPMWQGKALIVAATHPAGLAAARALAVANAAGELLYDVAGLILVHDRPRLSKATATLAKGIGRMFPLTLVVPYEPSWREPGVTPTASSLRLKRTLGAINKFTEK